MEPLRRDSRHESIDWPHYRETVLHFGDPVTWSVPVRRLAADASSRLDTFGLTGPFAVISAFHPSPQRLDRETNLARHERLKMLLAERRIPAVPCAGASVDGSHREEGFAACCPRETAVEIASAFGQAAIYWWDGLDLWIEPALAEVPAERIRP
jgi:hypothetical protein